MSYPDAPIEVSTDLGCISVPHAAPSTSSSPSCSSDPPTNGTLPAQYSRTRNHVREPGTSARQIGHNPPGSPPPTTSFPPSATGFARVAIGPVSLQAAAEMSPKISARHGAPVIHQAVPLAGPKPIDAQSHIPLHIRQHPLFPCLCELAVFRHRASVTTTLTASQEIFSEAISSVERHFTQRAVALQDNEAATAPTAMTVDECIRATMMTLLSHIAEYHHQCAGLQVVSHELFLSASNRFASTVMPGSRSPQQAVASLVSPPQSSSANATGPSPTDPNSSSKDAADPDLRDGMSKNSSSPSDALRPKPQPHHPRVKRLLQSWLDEHAHHPFPDEEQKTLLAELTGLNRAQLDNWFVNARRRRRKKSAANTGEREESDLA